MNKRQALALLFFLAFLAILLHQLLVYGVLIELKDTLHHEFFAFVFLAFGIGLGLGEALE